MVSCIYIIQSQSQSQSRARSLPSASANKAWLMAHIESLGQKRKKKRLVFNNKNIIIESRSVPDKVYVHLQRELEREKAVSQPNESR